MTWHLHKIPKTAYFYWGNETISFLRYLTIFSFQKFNPDWKIILYYPKTRYQGKKTWPTRERYGRFKGKNYIKQLFDLDIKKVEVDFNELDFDYDIPENYKADFLRWKLLSTAGGLWSDFDIMYFKPMRSLYFNDETNRDIDTVVCINEYKNNSVGFLLASPGNDLCKFVHDESYSRLDVKEYQSMGPVIMDSYFPTISSINDRFSNLKVHNMKMDVVYPVHDNPPRGRWASSMYRASDLSYITGDTIGLHWYAGHPDVNEWENMLTENSFKKYDNVLAKVIGKVFGEGKSG